MTGYADLPTSQIDADSPLIEDTMIKLRDNPLAMFEGAAGAPRLQTAAIQDAAVTNAKIAAGAVKQASLNTSTGTVSGTITAVLPGGEYGFYPRVWGNPSLGNLDFGATIANSAIYTSATTTIKLSAVEGTPYASQRYINSSPPYNIGDGEVPVFVFALVDSSGKVIGTYTADVPPWAYNGPTSVIADAIDQKNGKKYQNRKIMTPSGDIITTMIEVNDAIKNADMPLIPHPFTPSQGESVVLLSPCDTLELLELHECGESIASLLMRRDLLIDNAPAKCAAPPGVMPVPVRWKNAAQKWRAAPAIAAKLQAMK